MKPWDDLKLEYNLTNETFLGFNNNNSLFRTSRRKLLNRILLHHLIKGALIITFEKLSSKELYSILIKEFTNRPSPNVYFEKIFPNMKFDWRKIYISPRILTINSYLRSFQYKILINILFLNEKLFVFRLKNLPLSSFVIKKKRHRCISFSECHRYPCHDLVTFLKKKT